MHFASMYQKGKIMNWDFEGEMYSQKKNACVYMSKEWKNWTTRTNFFVAKSESLMHKYTTKLLNSKINGSPIQEISWGELWHRNLLMGLKDMSHLRGGWLGRCQELWGFSFFLFG